MSEFHADANGTIAFLRPVKDGDPVYVGYGKGTDVAKISATLVGHYAHTEFAARDHALVGYLIHRAYRQIGLARRHSVPARDAMIYLGGNRARLIESLNRLSNGLIEIAADNDDEPPCGITCKFLEFEYNEGTEMVDFSFPVPLVEKLANPLIFALLSLEKLRRFKSVTAIRLFEIMSLRQHVRLENTNFIELDIQELHTVLGDFVGTKVERGDHGLIQALRPRTWSEYNRHVLQKAITEVNLVADFNVYAQVNKSVGRGRAVCSVTFFAKAKTLSEFSDARHGKVVSQDLLRRSLEWSKKNETPAGLLKPHKRYVAPNIHNRKSPYYGCEFQVSQDVMCKAETMAESVGLLALEVVRTWQDIAAKKDGRSKKFDPDKNFMRYLERRCNVARSNRKIARRDFLSLSNVDPKVSERVKMDKAFEKFNVIDTTADDINQTPQYCYNTDVYADKLDQQDDDPRFDNDKAKVAAAKKLYGDYDQINAAFSEILDKEYDERLAKEKAEGPSSGLQRNFFETLEEIMGEAIRDREPDSDDF
jgi:hypothetical protein